VCTSIWYPCKIKICKKKVWGVKIKYPCGMKFCSKKVCMKLGYPRFFLKSFTFTIGDIIDGVLSLSELIKIPAMKMIDLLVKGLGIPKLSQAFPRIPGFPDLNLFNKINGLDIGFSVGALGGIDIKGMTDWMPRFPEIAGVCEAPDAVQKFVNTEIIK
jgi:hypothetical protein